MCILLYIFETDSDAIETPEGMVIFSFDDHFLKTLDTVSKSSRLLMIPMLALIKAQNLWSFTWEMFLNFTYLLKLSVLIYL